MFLGWFGGHHAVYVPPGLRGRVRQRAQPRENVCCALFHTASFSHRTPEAITKVDRELREGASKLIFGGGVVAIYYRDGQTDVRTDTVGVLTDYLASILLLLVARRIRYFVRLLVCMYVCPTRQLSECLLLL